jgi:hypothetical protein
MCFCFFFFLVETVIDNLQSTCYITYMFIFECTRESVVNPFEIDYMFWYHTISYILEIILCTVNFLGTVKIFHVSTLHCIFLSPGHLARGRTWGTTLRTGPQNHPSHRDSRELVRAGFRRLDLENQPALAAKACGWPWSHHRGLWSAATQSAC